MAPIFIAEMEARLPSSTAGRIHDVMETTVRPATTADAQFIVDFNLAMALETENIPLDPVLLGKGVRAALADPLKASYFIGECDSHVAGMLMITHEWSDWRNGDIWWIQSVYVHPDFRRHGLFKAMYRYVEQAARKAGALGFRLYVVQQNVSAQKTYERLGMHVSEYVVMENLKLADTST
jgi:ribosomal protein S18 acetylase RimI-like enzyme